MRQRNRYSSPLLFSVYTCAKLREHMDRVMDRVLPSDICLSAIVYYVITVQVRDMGGTSVSIWIGYYDRICLVYRREPAVYCDILGSYIDVYMERPRDTRKRPLAGINLRAAIGNRRASPLSLRVMAAGRASAPSEVQGWAI